MCPLPAAFSTHQGPEANSCWVPFLLLLFEQLSAAGVRWGFVSGAEPPSARFVLEQRLGLAAPPLIAMGEAPDKPDPTGLLQLAETLAGQALGPGEGDPGRGEAPRRGR